ncbi:hypothetical protein Bca52824_082294 [Brassica carinata]|uniref:Uncharacterized protein n=1 Tax=Brassica carinata TaxID=52824 RepID=A0A8X7PKC2_BRACI|nr:hypothetical protein Bca52824_082294 [Brassica carinata]
MPGGWSLDAERVWFRLVRSDFRVWQEAPLLLVGSIARGGGSAVSSVLLRLVASVLPHSVQWMRGEAVQSGGSDFQSLIFPEMYEVEVSAFWRGHSVLLSVGFGGASGPRSEISDLLTVRFELCLGSSSRDQEFSFSHLQFVSTLLSSSIWLPWCSPTVLILSGLWVWTLRPLCSNG